jgi:hypothetical protein
LLRCSLVLVVLVEAQVRIRSADRTHLVTCSAADSQLVTGQEHELEPVLVPVPMQELVLVLEQEHNRTHSRP